jgi:hypothetical protein
MSGRLIPAFAQFFDGSGDPLVNGYIKFLETNTTNTEKDTYANESSTIKNPNPLQLDAEGRCGNVWGSVGGYRVITYDGDPDDVENPGQQIQMFDPVYMEGTNTAPGGSTGSFNIWDISTTYGLGDIVTHSNKYYRSLLSTNVGNNPASTPSAWEEIKFLPVYNSVITYSIGDTVLYANNIYISLTNSNLNNQPDQSSSNWRVVADGITTVENHIVDYTILPADINKLLVFASGATASRTFTLPAMDATTDRFKIHVYVESANDLILEPNVLNSIWLSTGGVTIQQGTFLSLQYFYETNKWSVIGGNPGYFLGGQNIGSSSIPVTTAYITSIYGTAAYIGILAINATEAFLTGEVHFADGSETSNFLGFGGSDDFKIWHQASGSTHLRNFTGSLIIYQQAAGNFNIGCVYNNNLQFVTNSITRWTINGSGNLLPSAPYDIGSTTLMVDNIYQQDLGIHYFGNSQDALIYFTGTDFIIRNSLGNTLIDNSNGNILLRTGGGLATRFTITAAGNLITGDGDGTVNSIVLGAGSDMEIYHTGTASYLNCLGALPLYIGVEGLSTIGFYTNNIVRWMIDSSGHLLPNGGNNYNIGSSVNSITDMFMHGSGEFYYGDEMAGYPCKAGRLPNVTLVVDTWVTIIPETDDMCGLYVLSAFDTVHVISITTNLVFGYWVVDITGFLNVTGATALARYTVGVGVQLNEVSAAFGYPWTYHTCQIMRIGTFDPRV